MGSRRSKVEDRSAFFFISFESNSIILGLVEKSNRSYSLLHRRQCGRIASHHPTRKTSCEVGREERRTFFDARTLLLSSSDRIDGFRLFFLSKRKSSSPPVLLCEVVVRVYLPTCRRSARNAGRGGRESCPSIHLSLFPRKTSPPPNRQSTRRKDAHGSVRFGFVTLSPFHHYIDYGTMEMRGF